MIAARLPRCDRRGGGVNGLHRVGSIRSSSHCSRNQIKAKSNSNTCSEAKSRNKTQKSMLFRQIRLRETEMERR